MSKYARPIVLAFAMAALAGGAMTAQDKKGAAPQGKKEEKKAVKGKVEYYEGGDGWRWKVTVGEKAIAQATKGVKKKEDVLKEIEDVKAILNAEKPVEGEPTEKAKEKKEKDKDKKDKDK
jgi:hypothetical protein